MSRSRSGRGVGGASVVMAALSILAMADPSVRAAEPPAVDALDAVAQRHGLERVDDAPGRQAAAALLSPFAAIGGDVVAIDATMRRAEAGATLWLVDYRSRAQGPRLAQGRRNTIDLPRLAIVVELAQPPGWPAFRQSAAAPAPPVLPAAWHPRLAAMGEYRMGIEGRVVAFFSQVQSAALLHLTESTTSPEFHPNLRNSALGVDVQRALDVVGALPRAPKLARFMRIDGVTPDLPVTDRAPLDRMRATAAQAQADTRRAADEAVRSMAEAGAELRRRSEADRERFRQRIAEATAKTRGNAAARAASPAEATTGEGAAAGESAPDRAATPVGDPGDR